MAEFSYSNVEREMEVFGYDAVVKSHCRMCHGGCGVLVYTQNGRVAKIGGDPERPINHGTLCSKGMASSQLAYHPDRLIYPLRRIGPKASGQWERISWDEALNTIAGRILDYREKFGAESIVMGYGTGNIDVPGGQVLFSTRKSGMSDNSGPIGCCRPSRRINAWERTAFVLPGTSPSSIPNAFGMRF